MWFAHFIRICNVCFEASRISWGCLHTCMWETAMARHVHHMPNLSTRKSCQDSISTCESRKDKSRSPLKGLRLPDSVFHHCLQSCGVSARDAQGIDISQNIIAVDVSPCPANSSCPLCDIALAQAGLCVPGKYLFLYHIQDSAGRPSQELRTVQIAAVWFLTLVRIRSYMQSWKAHHIFPCYTN